MKTTLKYHAPNRRPRRLKAIDPLSAAQKAQLAAWLFDINNTYDQIVELARTQLQRDIPRTSIQRFYKRLADSHFAEFAPELEDSAASIIQSAASGKTNFTKATYTLLERKAFELALTERTPDDFTRLHTTLRSLQLHDKNHIDQQNADTRRLNAQTAENNHHLKRIIHETKLEKGSYEKTPRKLSPPVNSSSGPSGDSGPCGEHYPDCAKHPLDGAPLHGPQQLGCCGTLTTDDYDQKTFDIFGLVADERQKRALYNSMLDLGVPQDVAAMYRDEILHQTGITTHQHHYIPAATRNIDNALNALPPTPAATYLPHYGLTGEQLQPIIWRLKDNPTTFATPNPNPCSSRGHETLISNTAPQPETATALAPTTLDQANSEHGTRNPEQQEPTPLTERISRVNRLRTILAELRLPTELAEAYLTQLLQLCHPAFVPGQTTWQGNTKYSHCPDPSEDQQITQSLYPTPADIHLARHHAPIDPQNAADRWALPPQPLNHNLTLPSSSKTTPAPEPPPTPEHLPTCPYCQDPTREICTDLHTLTDDLREPLAAASDHYTIKRAEEYCQHQRDIVGWPVHKPEPQYITKHKSCPCGHQLPCPHHEPFPENFWTLSPFGLFYEHHLRDRGIPFRRPGEFL